MTETIEMAAAIGSYKGLGGKLSMQATLQSPNWMYHCQHELRDVALGTSGALFLELSNKVNILYPGTGASEQAWA